MSERTVVVVFEPAAVGSNETTALVTLDKGERVVWCSVQKLVLADGTTGSTATVGDGSDVDGYVTTTNLDLETGAVGDVVNGSGAYLATSGGKLYTAADTVDVVYTASGTPGTTVPRIAVLLRIARDWPHVPGR